jgi:hypothetical protein
MRYLFILWFAIFLFSANAHEQNITTLKLGNQYFIFTTCEGADKDKGLEGILIFHLMHGDNELSSLTGGGCETNIELSDNFDGYGKKAITVSPRDGVMPTTSMDVFVVDLENRRIIAAGNLPIMAELLKNGEFVYKANDPYSKVKTVYAFSGNELLMKKTTMLVYNGKVCSSSIYDILSVSAECDNAIVATQDKPVCVEQYSTSPSQIIPLDKCDIKKEEIADLHD